MAEFLQIPPLEIHGRSHWKLVDELVYLSDLWPDPITVPTGFVTDLASIPRIPGVRALIPQNGAHRAPAIVHDFLVRSDGFDRPLADRIFLEAMEAVGVKRWRRTLMFWAVRIQTAWLTWRKQ